MRLHHLAVPLLLVFMGALWSGCDANSNRGASTEPNSAATAVVAATENRSLPDPTATINADSEALTATVDVAVVPTAVLSATEAMTIAGGLTESNSAAANAPIAAAQGLTLSAGTTDSENSTLLSPTEEPVLVPTDTPPVQAAAQLTATDTVSNPDTSTDTSAASADGGAPGTVLNVQFVERVTAAAIDQASQFFYPADNLLEARYDVDIYRLEVQSTTETGDPIDLQTDVYVPRVDDRTAFPIFAYAPGTTGLGDSCAPSQEIVLGRGWGSYYTHMLSYAGQGYIGVIPDGMSYDDPERPHEYFIAELEAHTLLDAVRGAQRFLAEGDSAAQPLDAIFFGGYSNGGHTAFAAKDFAAEYAPELPIRGIISHGATTNVETLMRESPVFTPYLIYAYQFYYGEEVITPQQVFTQNWLPTFTQDVATKCVDEIFVYYSNDPVAMYNAEFRNALVNGELAERFPLFKTVLDANYAGTFGGFDLPVVFFQGTADSTVTPLAQQEFAQDLCAQEQPVTYSALPTVRHVDTRQRSFIATLEWMQTIVDGEMPENTCGELIGE